VLSANADVHQEAANNFQNRIDVHVIDLTAESKPDITAVYDTHTLLHVKKERTQDQTARLYAVENLPVLTVQALSSVLGCDVGVSMTI